MNLFNFLATNTITINAINEKLLGNVPMTGVASLVKTIIEALSFGGIIAVGILLFSLILKVLPLPLDVFSRASTKKNALKMEKIRPQLERLQKQYANDKTLYNQKLMALYKKEGYSTFASCLPTLITLIFFIIVITAFNKYSTYTNLEAFNDMARAYNYSISLEDEYFDTVKDGDYIVGFKLKEGVELTEEKANEIKNNAQKAAADSYISTCEKAKFLWVSNIWVADLPWKKAFLSYEDFKGNLKYSDGLFSTKDIKTSIDEATYNDLTAHESLNVYKEKANGYLGLVVLSIGTMLISQIVMSKSQKAQMELQSVDGANGQAAQTSKMMMWMMPIMFGIFSFFYSAAFSIYLIISTTFSMLSTLVINAIVEKKFAKQVQKEEEDKYNQRFKHLRKDK